MTYRSSKVTSINHTTIRELKPIIYPVHVTRRLSSTTKVTQKIVNSKNGTATTTSSFPLMIKLVSPQYDIFYSYLALEKNAEMLGRQLQNRWFLFGV